jgi:hypothetical protein
LFGGEEPSPPRREVPSSKCQVPKNSRAWKERGTDQARRSLVGLGPRVAPVATCLRPAWGLQNGKAERLKGAESLLSAI